MKKDFVTDKLYYGFPIFILGYKDEEFGYNITTCSSSYSLGNQLVIGIIAKENAAQQIQKFGEFTLNIPHEESMLAVERAGFSSHKDKLREFDFQLSTKVDAPVLDFCPLTLECKVEKTTLDNGICHVFAKIIGRQIEEDCLDENGHLLHGKLSPVYFLGDGSRRVYRYLDHRSDFLGKFIKNEGEKDENS